MIGQLVGKYRIDRLIGEGGMGRVYAATHARIGTRVAIKMLKADAIAKPTIGERFMREARAAGQLESEHACHVLDIGTTDDGLPYIVMELLDGRDLATVIRDERPSVVAVASYIAQACQGLAEAHARGMVHRDIKPANLFLTKRNGAPFVKILDFGIATAPRDEQHPSLTHTQMVMGSPNYMSPEQIRSAKEVDPRSDVWSLGVTLYELISGQLPFQRPTYTALSIAVTTEPHRPLTEAPSELVAIVDRCLEKKPERRYASAAELARALATFRAVASGETRVAVAAEPQPSLATTLGDALGEQAARGKPKRRRGAAFVALGAAAIGGGAFALFARGGGAKIDRARDAYDRWSAGWRAAKPCLVGGKSYSADLAEQIDLHALLDAPVANDAPCRAWMRRSDGGSAAPATIDSTLASLTADDFDNPDRYAAVLHLDKTIGDLICGGKRDCTPTPENIVAVDQASERVRESFGLPPEPRGGPPAIAIADARVATSQEPTSDYAGWTLRDRAQMNPILVRDKRQEVLDVHGHHVDGIVDATDPILWARTNELYENSGVRIYRLAGGRWQFKKFDLVADVLATTKRLDVLVAKPRKDEAVAGPYVWETFAPHADRSPAPVPFRGIDAGRCASDDVLWLLAVDGDAEQLLRFTRGDAKPIAFAIERSASFIACGTTSAILRSAPGTPFECIAATAACARLSRADPLQTLVYVGDRLVRVDASRSRRFVRIVAGSDPPAILRMPRATRFSSMYLDDGHLRARVDDGSLVVELL